MKIKVSGLFLSIILLTGCSSMKFIEYDMQNTPQVSLSDSLNLVMLYNVNSSSMSRSVKGLDVPADFSRVLFSEITEIESQRYAGEIEVIGDTEGTGKPITKADVEKLGLSEKNIVSLDKVSLKSYSRGSVIDNDWHVFDLYCPVEVGISIYTPGDSIVHYLYNDTLMFSGAGNDLQEAFETLPSSESCIEEIIDKTTEIIEKQYLPFNDNVVRLFFVSNKTLMHRAEKFWKVGKYDEASYLWQHVYEDKRNKKLRAKAAANMALYYEQKSDYDAALMWARISFALFSRKKDVYDLEIAYLSDYINRLRSCLK